MFNKNKLDRKEKTQLDWNRQFEIAEYGIKREYEAISGVYVRVKRHILEGGFSTASKLLAELKSGVDFFFKPGLQDGAESLFKDAREAASKLPKDYVTSNRLEILKMMLETIRKMPQEAENALRAAQSTKAPELKK